jgi:2-methylcitrate dehydratase PrpD
MDVRAQLAARGITPNEVARIEVGVNASAAKLCRPIEERRRPATLQDAKYSIPWMAAFTLARGTVDLATLNDAALPATDIRALADKVDIVENLPDKPGHPPAQIRVHVDGAMIENAAVQSFEMDARQARAKFDACLAQADMQAQSAALYARLLALDTEPGAQFLFS